MELKRLEPQSGIYALLHKSIRFLLPKIWNGKFRFTGLENIPPRGSAILAINHTAHIDPIFLMAAMKRPVHFMSPEDRLVPAYLQAFYHSLGSIIMTMNLTKSGGKRFVRQIQDVARYEELIGIFPEGMLEFKPERENIVAFKSGVASIARRYHMNVIPIFIRGTNDVMPNSSPSFFQRIHLKPVSIRIGSPLYYQNIAGEECIRQAILALAAG